MMGFATTQEESTWSGMPRLPEGVQQAQVGNAMSLQTVGLVMIAALASAARREP